jgi:hypothetical protein
MTTPTPPDQSPVNAKETPVPGLIIEEVGAGWTEHKDGTWISPSGERYVWITAPTDEAGSKKPLQ